MHQYYFDSPQEETRPVSVVQTAPEPARPPSSEKPRKKRRPRSDRGAALVLAALALVLGGTAALTAFQAGPALDNIRAWSYVPHAPSQPAVSPLVSVPAELERWPAGDGTALTLAPRPEGEPMRLQEIYQRVIPSIVSINGTMSRGIAQGTGVVMSEDGYIITNAHVIEGCFRVDISLSGGERYQAKLVGSDPSTDLAVLKVEADGLTPAVFGNSEDMLVGDTVVAIGNPMGEELRGTMTDGILSAINRDMEVDGNRMTLLQTTAALNTGNSGGALVNDQGQVIGITNMKLVSTAYTNTLEGLGFAIPTTTVKPVVDALIGSGHVTGRPTLGVTVRGLYDEEKAARSVDHGILVVSLSEGSDAAGKLKPEDILLSANGVKLNLSDDLLGVKESLGVGDAILFEVDRDGQRLEVSVALMEQYQIYG